MERIISSLKKFGNGGALTPDPDPKLSHLLTAASSERSKFIIQLGVNDPLATQGGGLEADSLSETVPCRPPVTITILMRF